MNEIEDEPFRLIQPARAKPKKKATVKQRGLSKADIEILERYIHREDYTREELAKRFGITIRQLRLIIDQQGWGKKDGEDDAEDNVPIGEDPTPCPFPPGSEGKLWILEERYARRLELFNPRDRVKPESEAERRARIPKRERRPPPEPTAEELDAIEKELEELWPEGRQQSQSRSPSCVISESRHLIRLPDYALTVSRATSH